MTADPPVGERELDADGWPVGMTREQILAAAGATEEEARTCERLAALSETEFEAYLERRLRQIGTTTKIPSGRRGVSLSAEPRGPGGHRGAGRLHP